MRQCYDNVMTKYQLEDKKSKRSEGMVAARAAAPLDRILSGLSERCDAWAGSSLMLTENMSQVISVIPSVVGEGKLNKR